MNWKDLGGLIAVVLISAGVSRRSEADELACASRAVDMATPTSGQTDGYGATADAATDSAASQASMKTCARCSLSGCSLGSAGNGVNDFDAGDGGSIFYGHSPSAPPRKQYFIKIKWGPNSSVAVSCSECAES